jgi:uncharacterized repeat protein (TIGR01451 family)/fimbrial isopeptide formation D2 family protein
VKVIFIKELFMSVSYFGPNRFFRIAITVFVVAGILFNAFASQVQPAYAAANDISGRVVKDVEGDAVITGPRDVPLQGVRVYLFRDNNGNNIPDNSDVHQATAITDAAGNYTFTTALGQPLSAMPNGVYWIVVETSTVDTLGATIEQTYGAAGVMIDPDSNSATETDFRASAGAAYGGRRMDTYDSFTSTNMDLNVAEHVIRIQMDGTSEHHNVDFGFGFIDSLMAGYSDFYFPGNTNLVWETFETMDDDSALNEATGMRMIASVTTSTNDTIIFYDHWENGLNFNPNDPYNTADEIRTVATGGTPVIFESKNIPVKPRGAAQYYDFGDAIHVTGGPVSVNVNFWPESISTVFASSWVLYPAKPFQTSYTIPGKALAGLGYADFTHVFAIIQATEDGTVVSATDANGNAMTLVRADPTSATGFPISAGTSPVLNKGESVLLGQVRDNPANTTLNNGTTGGVVIGTDNSTLSATIIGSKPIQVNYRSGNPLQTGVYSQSRGITATPNILWDDEYYLPVPARPNSNADAFFTNANPYAITIYYESSVGSNSFVVPAGTTRSFQALTGGWLGASAYHFKSAGNTKFTAIAHFSTEDANYDWGINLVPGYILRNEYYLGWAPGGSNYPAGQTQPPYTPTVNYSPAWITPRYDDTTVYVDANFDGITDGTFVVNRLESLNVRASDFGLGNDNSGMRIWATGPLAVAWGQDSNSGQANTPGMDMGYTILPLPMDWMDAALGVIKTVDNPTLPVATNQPVNFTLSIPAWQAVSDLVVSDLLPPSWTYQPQSTTITTNHNGVAESWTFANTVNVEPAQTVVGTRTRLAWNVQQAPFNITSLDPNEYVVLKFTARTPALLGNIAIGYNQNDSEVCGLRDLDGNGSPETTFCTEDYAHVFVSPVMIDKDTTTPVVAAGNNATYQIRVVNTDTSAVTGITIGDELPFGFTYVAGSATATINGVATTDPDTVIGGTAQAPTWAIGSVPAGGTYVLTYQALVASTIAAGTYDNDAWLDSTMPGIPLFYDHGQTGEDPGTVIRGGVNEDPEQDEDVTVIARTLEVQKGIIATSEIGTDAYEVAVGEIVRYRVQTQLPETTVTGFYILDRIVPGMMLLENSVRLSIINNDGTLSVTDTYGANDSAAINAARTTGTAPYRAVTYSLPDDNLSSQLASESDDYTSNMTTTGTNVYFKIGNITNSPNVAHGEYIVIEYDALVLNIAANQQGKILDNYFTANITEDFDGVVGSDSKISNSVAVSVIEPTLTITKEYAPRYISGAWRAVYEITVSNPGTVDAYDLTVTDQLDNVAGGSLDIDVAGDIVQTASNGTVENVVVTPNFATEYVSISIGRMAANSSVTFAITADFVGAVGNPIAANTANLTYTSLPGTQGTAAASNPTEAQTPGATGTQTGERNGSNGVGGLNDYVASATAAATTIPGVLPATINGVVYRDDGTGGGTADDGTRNGTEPGIPNVTVTLTNAGPDGIHGNADDVAIGTTTTDVNGNYSFTGLAAGNYRINVDSSDPDLDSRRLTSANDPTNVVLAAGGTSTVNFGFDHTGRIGDTVFTDNGAGGGIAYDGLQNGTEAGIVGVGVTLIEAGTDGAFGTADDVTVGTQTTIAAGQYSFTHLPPGKYHVDVNQAAAPLAGMFLTTGNDPQTIYLNAGSTDNSADFGFAAINLNINKTSDKGGIVNPGDVINYTITIENGGSVLTNIAVTDLIPAGTTYVANSALVVQGATLAAASTTAASDAFPTAGNGGTGTGWLAGWVEVGGEADGFGAGDIRINNFVAVAPLLTSQLRIQNNNEGAYRRVNLSAYGTASISLDYQSLGTLTAANNVTLAVSTNGAGGPWTVLRTWNTNGTGALTNLDLTPYISADTYIRFIGSGTLGVANGLYVDNIVISGQTRTAVTNQAAHAPSGILIASDAYYLAPTNGVAGNGPDFMSITYQVRVDNPLAGSIPSIDNTVRVTAAQFTPVEVTDSAHDSVLTYAIGNSVWLDEDGNGYQDTGEPGIPNATVQLWDSTHTTLLQTTTTDANGGYVFKGVIPGTYQVDVSNVPAGLVQTTDPAGDADFTNKAEPYTLVVTTGGGDSMIADFGYNWAPAADTDGNINTGAIGDRLWIDDGDGMQESGEPGLYNVTVDLLTAGADGIFGTADDVVAATTTSGYDGSYIFDGLVAGAYAIRVNGGAAPAGYTQTGDPDGTLDNRTTTSIFLAPGDVYINADFGYQPTLVADRWNIGDTLWLDIDRGDDVDVGEPLLAGVTVALIRDLDGDGTWDTGEPIIATDITDANGTYLFTNLPITDGVGTDDYLVWVNDTENVLSGLSPVYDSNGTGTLNVSAVTDLAAADNLAQDFGYAPTGHDSGEGLIGDTIFYDLDGGNDYDVGEKLEGVRIELYQDVNNNNVWDSGDTLLATTFSNENGQYFFGGLSAGEYVVRVATATLPVGVTNTVDPDTANPGDSQSAVTLAAGGVNVNQDFGYRDTSSPNTISGTIWRDSNADGVLDAGEIGRFDGVTVILRNSSGNIVATATTSGGGNYTFANLPDDTYTVDVSDAGNLLNGYWHSLGLQGETDDNQSKADPYTITLAAGENRATADFGFYSDPAAIGDRIWNDLDNDGIQDAGEPGMADVLVTLTTTYPNASVVTLQTRTDVSGNYTFGNLLADEDFDGAGAGEPTFVITVTPPTGYSATLSNQGADDTVDSDGLTITALPVEGATNTTYDTGLVPGATIGNAVWLDENGNGYQDAGEVGIANITVELWNSGHTAVLQTVTTDANGGYAFKNVAAGTYQVDVLNSSLPTGLVQTTVIGGTADFTGKADPFSVTVVSGQENLTADFGFNYAPPADTGGNLNTGAIGDRLWIDDGDGVQEPGEPGLYNVTVDLLTAGADGIFGTADDVVAATTASAYDGSYIFDGLNPGGYVIRVNGGVAPTNYTPTGDPDGTLDNRTTSPILLAPGDVYVNADFGYQPTAGNGGDIGNLLWVDVDRDNADDGGASEPRLPGVTVSLIRDLDGDGVWDSGEPIIATDITDSAGTYRFTNVSTTDGVGTDDYLVWVNDTENILAELTPTYDNNGVGTPNISSVIDLAAAGDLNQDFAYAPYGHDAGEGFIGDTVYYDGNVSGNFQPGEGMEGVRVFLYQDNNSDGNYDAGETLLATTWTNENGRYFFGGVPSNGTTDFVVVVDTTTIPGYSVPNGITNTVDPGGPADPNQSPVTDLATGGSNVVQDFGYRDTTTPNTISGTLWRDTNANGVLGGAEAGRFDNVTIVLRNSAGSIIATTTTAGGGNYSFANLPDGTYTVDVSDDADLLNGYWHSLGNQAQATDGTSKADPYTVTLTGNQIVNTVDFGYYRDPASLGDRVWNDLDGDGIQDAGEPGLSGVAVSLTITWPGGAGTTTLQTRTDASGNYTFGNLLADEDFDGAGAGEPTFVIAITSPSGYSATLTDQGGNDAVDSDGLTITAAPVEGTTNTSYDAGLTVGGTIGNALWLDENGDGSRDAGEPGLVNITVRLCADAACASVLQTTVTDADGGYAFKNVATGSYYVDVLDSSLPTGLVQTTVIGGTADNTNKADFFNLSVTAGSEVLYADFGYNYAPPADTDGNINTGTIGDRLWVDDGDGVQEPGEPGLYNVTVDLLTAGADGIFGTADDVVAATTASAYDGSYIFDGLAAGAYVVRVNGGAAPSGYTLTGDPDSTLDNTTTAPIFLAPGDVYINADFGYTPTANAGNIGDTLWLDVDRDNVDDGAASEPRLAGVTVALIRDLNGNGSWDSGEPIIAQDVTDANGNYLFTNIPASGTEDYLAWVNDTESVLFGLNPTFDSNGAATPNISAVTDLTAAGNLNQDFAYAPLGHDAGEGLIGDTLFYDRNSSGAPNAGEGMEGARVYLYQDNNADGNYDGGETLLATVWTNENGQYFFGGLPAGDYVVLVDVTTLPSSLYNTVDPDTLNSPVSEAGITLAAGGINLTQDFGYQESTPLSPNTVAGTFWRDSDADGALDAGEAGRFANVTVVLRTTSGNIIAATTTDASGNYTFNLVPDGTFVVDVTDDANVLNGYWHSLGDQNVATDGSSKADPYTFTVTGNQTVNTLDFGYYRENSSIGDWVWRDDDGDGIQDGPEPGLPGVEVVLTITWPGGAGTTTLRTTTDVNGEYTFANVLLDEDFDGSGAGEPTFSVSVVIPTGYNPSPANVGGNDAVDSDNPFGAPATPTEATPDLNADFGLIPGAGAIGDRIWLDENSDGVQDAGEPGIPNVVVELQTDSCNAGLDCPTTVTDSEGRYSFVNLPPSANYSVAVLSGLPAGLNANPTYDEDGIGTPNISAVILVSGQEYTTADFGYNWSASGDVTGNTGLGTIGDRLWVDANGNGLQEPGEPGLPGISVALINLGADGILGTADDTTTSTTSGPDGSYIFDDLAAGSYVVRVNGGAAPAGYTLTGDPDQPGAACTACDNRTTTPILLAPGDVYVNTDFGYRPAASSTIGDQIFLDVDGNGSFGGSDVGLPGVTVALLNNSGVVIASTTTNASGQYSFPGLPAGTYTVWVNDTANLLGGLTQTSDPDGGNDSRSTTAVDGSTNVLTQDHGYAPAGHGAGDGLIGDTIFLDRDGGLDYDPGEGIEGVRVYLFADSNADGNYDAGEPLVATTVSNENGQYFFGNLPAGNYVVRVDTNTLPAGLTQAVDAGNATPNEGGLDLTGGNIVNLAQDFGYDGANTISGTLWRDTHADGTLTETGRLTGVTVALYNSNGNLVATTVTDGSGNYTFDNLPNGTYRVDVTDDGNVLDGFWYSTGGAPGTDGNSQADPYTVTVTGGQTDTTADFGYYRDPASVSNLIWLDRNNDGIQDNLATGEPGIRGITVTLTINYPGLAGSINYSVRTGSDGTYTFGNLLLDENTLLADSGAGTPTYTISVSTPPGMTASPENANSPTNDDQLDGDSDGASEIATVAKGETDVSYDFGFYTLRLDLGDLPNTYPTLFSPGPANIIFPDTDSDGNPNTAGGYPAVWLGLLADVENNGQPNSAASGDDSNGQDDEDGLKLAPSVWIAGNNATMTVIINSDASGVRVHYGIWIDWNQDAVFETFLSGSELSGSPVNVPVNVLVPATYVANSSVYFRVRASDQPLTAADYQGTLLNGETEDYATVFTPTAVKLVEARATPLLPPSWLLIAVAMLLLVSLTGVAALAYARKK